MIIRLLRYLAQKNTWQGIMLMAGIIFVVLSITSYLFTLSLFAANDLTALFKQAWLPATILLISLSLLLAWMLNRLLGQINTHLDENLAYQEKLRQVIDNLPFFVWYRDSEQNIQVVNKAYANFFGFNNPLALEGKKETDIWPSDIAKRYAEDEAAIMLSKSSARYEEHFPKIDKWYQIYRSCLVDSEDKAIGSIGFAEDISKRKNAEKSLHDAAMKQLFLLDSINAISWEYDLKQARFSFVSPNAERLTSYPQDEWQTMDSWVAMIHPDDQAKAASYCRLETEAGRDHHFEYRLVKKNGEIIWVLDLVTVVKDEQGKAQMLTGFILDNTEQHDLRVMLELNQKSYKQAQKIAHIGHWELDIKNQCAKWSEEVHHIAGTHPNQQVGIEFLESIVHPNDWPMVQESLNNAISKGHEHEIEYRINRNDGSERWVLCKAKRQLTSDGTPEKLAGIVQDITERKRFEIALNAEKEFIDSVINTAQAIILVLDTQGCIMRFNAYMEQLSGYSLEEVKGKDWFSTFLPSKDMPEIQKVFKRTIKNTYSDGQINPIISKDGRLIEIEWRNKTLLDENGQSIGVLALGQDISERIENEEKLQLAASVFSHANEGICITDPQGKIIDINHAFSQITGFTTKDAIDKTLLELKSGLHDDDFFKNIWRELEERGHWQGEIWSLRKSGEIYAEMVTISGVKNPNDEVLHYVVLFSDITPQKEQQKQLEYIAHYDSLTDLPNRVLLADRLHQAMYHAERREQGIAVVYLDLDGFKEINDEHGHDKGDQVLVTIASRLKSGLREGDTIARLGGDEFVAVLSDLNCRDDAKPLLERFIEAVGETISVEHLKLNVSASLGVTFFPQEQEIDADQLLRQADQAMYQAKLAGKNRYQVYDMEQELHIRGSHENIGRIRDALNKDEFVLFYQPKVNMRSGELIGLEALIRWQHPERGLLAPGAFLPFIENDPIAHDVGRWVFKTSIAQLSEWQEQGLETKVSLNVSAQYLQQACFIDDLQKALEQYPHINANNLELEILETSALEDIDSISKVIAQCELMGIQFALDDFGTGYSSLTYLKRLPASWLKIDRSFVHDMLIDSEDLAILEGVIGLAAAFRREVIAEGVESKEQGNMLLRLGCEYAQGYYIAKPMPASQLLPWKARWKPEMQWQMQISISRDDFPLLFASVEHRSWIAKVLAYLKQTQRREIPSECLTCRFDRWLAHDGYARYSSYPDFKALRVVHQHLHQLANELIEVHQDDLQSQVSEEQLAILEQLGEQFSDQLDILLAAAT